MGRKEKKIEKAGKAWIWRTCSMWMLSRSIFGANSILNQNLCFHFHSKSVRWIIEWNDTSNTDQMSISKQLSAEYVNGCTLWPSKWINTTNLSSAFIDEEREESKEDFVDEKLRKPLSLSKRKMYNDRHPCVIWISLYILWLCERPRAFSRSFCNRAKFEFFVERW